MSNAMGAASAAWLGDGRIVYAMRDDDGSSLWQSTLSGAPVRRKGFPGATLFVVNASGDGTRLAYAPVISQTDVYATEVTSSLALRQLTSHRRDDYPLAFTADGAGLVLLSDRRGHGMDIYRQELGARDAVLVGKGGCVHALAPGGGEVLVGRELEGALRFVGYDLTPGAVERRLPLTARDCQAKLRCGRAGCVLSEKVDDRLVLSRVDPASTASTPFARLAVSRSVWHLDAAGERVLIEDDAKRLLSIATRDGVITELAKPGCNLDFAFWGNGDDLFLTCVRRDPLLHSLVHRTVDGGETTLWSSAEQYLGSVTLSPDGRTMAVALRSFDANVWMLEGL